MNDNVEIPKVQGGLGGGGGGWVREEEEQRARWQRNRMCLDGAAPPPPLKKKKGLKNLTKAYLEIYICDLLGDTDFTVAESRP